MTKREKMKLRKDVEKAWAIEDKELAANNVYDLFGTTELGVGGWKLYEGWLARNIQIGRRDYTTKAARFHALRLNDMRLLKDIGA